MSGEFQNGLWKQARKCSCILTVSVDAESIVRSSSVGFIELMQSQVSPLVFLFTNAFTSIPWNQIFFQLSYKIYLGKSEIKGIAKFQKFSNKTHRYPIQDQEVRSMERQCPLLEVCLSARHHPQCPKADLLKWPKI